MEIVLQLVITALRLVHQDAVRSSTVLGHNLLEERLFLELIEIIEANWWQLTLVILPWQTLSHEL